MIDRLEAAEQAQLIETQLFANGYQIPEAERRTFDRRLQGRIKGRQEQERAPKITLDHARLIGAEIAAPPPEKPKPGPGRQKTSARSRIAKEVKRSK